MKYTSLIDAAARSLGHGDAIRIIYESRIEQQANKQLLFVSMREVLAVQSKVINASTLITSDNDFCAFCFRFHSIMPHATSEEGEKCSLEFSGLRKLMKQENKNLWNQIYEIPRQQLSHFRVMLVSCSVLFLDESRIRQRVCVRAMIIMFYYIF